MKPISIITLFIILIFSFIAGFFSSYIFTIIVLVLLLIFNLINFLGKTTKNSLKYIFFGISIFGIALSYHSGLLIRNNMRKVCSDTAPTNKMDSKFNTKPISLDSFEETIVTYSDFEIDTLEQINFNDTSFLIKKISSKNKTPNKTKILIVAGVHGSETANVYAIQGILKKIKSEKLLEAFHFEILYALNPVGISLFNRYNENNCDINRDFLQFKTVQSQLLKNLLKSEAFDYVLDLHEGSYGGHYFINNTSIKGLTANINKNLEKENIQMSPMLTNTLKDILFQYELDNPLTKMNQIMTFDNYLNTLGIENILSESNGLSSDFDERVQGHLIVFKQLIEALKE